MHACVLSHVQVFATPWTVAHQAPLSMGFPRQEYWRGLPVFPPVTFLCGLSRDISIFATMYASRVPHWSELLYFSRKKVYIIAIKKKSIQSDWKSVLHWGIDL